MKKYPDQSIERKKENIEEEIQYYKGIPLFSLLEFNIFGACNRACSFCPVSDKSFYKNVYQGIDYELYTKVIKELEILSYSGTILYSAFSEPLLNKQVFELIKSTKALLKDANLEIVTNGDVILKNERVLNKLFESGLDTLLISVYDGKKEFEEFKNLIRRNNVKDNVILRRRYYDGSNYGIIFSNRGGLVDTTEFVEKADEPTPQAKLPLMRTCYYPFYQMVIDFNGDVLMCAHDWKKELVLGNVKDQSILDIWKSRKMNFAQTRLSNEERTFKPCSNCNVLGDVMGKKNFDEWLKCN